MSQKNHTRPADADRDPPPDCREATERELRAARRLFRGRSPKTDLDQDLPDMAPDLPEDLSAFPIPPSPSRPVSPSPNNSVSPSPDEEQSSQPQEPPDQGDLPPGAELPYWLPTGSRWRALPAQLRRAALQILVPAYRQFVLEAPGQMERSLGTSLVHLLWLEISDQLQLAEIVADPHSLAASLDEPDKRIGRHLELVSAKCVTTELLVKLQMFRHMLTQPPAPPAIPHFDPLPLPDPSDPPCIPASLFPQT